MYACIFLPIYIPYGKLMFLLLSSRCNRVKADPGVQRRGSGEMGTEKMSTGKMRKWENEKMSIEKLRIEA
jgi:hypothetical protein